MVPSSIGTSRKSSIDEGTNMVSPLEIWYSLPSFILKDASPFRHIYTVKLPVSDGMILSAFTSSNVLTTKLFVSTIVLLPATLLKKYFSLSNSE